MDILEWKGTITEMKSPQRIGTAGESVSLNLEIIQHGEQQEHALTHSARWDNI